MRDVVLCEEIGVVVFAERAEAAGGAATGGGAPALLTAALSAPIDAIAVEPTLRVAKVVYDGEDLDAVAAAIARTPEDVVRMHADGDYVVAMLGFLPGFAYLRGLAPELCLPRRAPRPRVPARSVAIGADYTGIYPLASAGGWHLLGRAVETPAFELGDRVRFERVEAASPGGESPTGDTSITPIGAHLVVTRVAGLALIVDAGRAGKMHRGMPPGGPLVKRLFARANAEVGNVTCAGSHEACAAIELTGQLEVEARGGAVTIATDATGPVELCEGERRSFASRGRRVAYLAVAGGLDTPLVDGSRNALLAAGIGRPIRRGDTLPLAHSTGSEDVVPSRFDRLSSSDHDASNDDAIVLRAGPDTSDELRAAIEAGDFAISSASDRAGTRLTGTTLPTRVEASKGSSSGTRPSTPMVEGAVELTPSGLVVLGPDHPTTGGYPVPAVIASASRDAFFARPLGAAVRFTFRE